jgi:hypothetical protein
MLNIGFTKAEQQAVVNMAVQKVCENGDLEWLALLNEPLVHLTDDQRKQVHDAILTQMSHLGVARFIIGNPE